MFCDILWIFKSNFVVDSSHPPNLCTTQFAHVENDINYRNKSFVHCHVRQLV